PILPPDELWMTPDALRERLNQGDRIELCGATHARHAQASQLGDQPAPSLPLALRDSEPGAALKSFLSSYGGRSLIAADAAGRREALLEMLDAAGLKPEVLADFSAFLGTRGPGPATRDAPSFAIAVAPLEDRFALDAPQLAIHTQPHQFPQRTTPPPRPRHVTRYP